MIGGGAKAVQVDVTETKNFEEVLSLGDLDADPLQDLPTFWLSSELND